MVSDKPRALVITGFGVNCEAETARSLRDAGAEVSLVHLNDILDGRDRISEYYLLAFVGGFSFGDHIAAGRVMAIKLVGAPSGRGLFIQPISYTGSEIQIDPEAPSSGGLVGRIVLAR